MRILPSCTLCQRGVQLTAGPRQRGHDSPYRNRGDRSDLLVGTPLQLSKDNYFTEAGRKRLECSRKSLASLSCDCDRFGRGGRFSVQLFIELIRHLHSAIFLQPRITSVADDLQQPRTRVASIETLEEAKGTKHGILRIGTAGQNPGRQVECRIKMRKHYLLESCAVLGIQHI